MLHRSKIAGVVVLLTCVWTTTITQAQGQDSTSPPPVSAQKVKLPIGMNLAGIDDWTPGFPFKNLMWSARAWLTRNADGSAPFDTAQIEKIPLDAQGYPLEVPCRVEGVAQPQILFTIISRTTEPGRYVVLYDGVGEITAAMNTKLISAAPGRVVLQLNKGSGNGGYEGITITRSSRSDHVRNIRILREADEKADLQANPFRQDFLDYCKQWHALRFMDWMVTNNSLEKEWSGRKQPTFYTMVGQGGDIIGYWGKIPSEFQRRFSGGVALEIMIQLANMTQTDPWFNIPHRATPEYVTEFAKLVKEKLDPKRKVYVEYSNEVWNWQFLQAGYMIQSKIAADALIAAGLPKGITAWKGGVEPALPFDNGMVAKEGGVDHPERMAALDRRCFAAWESVFTGADRARMVRVVGVQHSWIDTADRTAKWVVEHGGADAIAPGGYIGPNGDIYKKWEAAGAALTGKQVVADLNAAFETDSATWSRGIAEIARKYKLRYIVYEGGQHIQPLGQQETAYMPALKAAQYDPGMYQAYMKNFRLHQELGCELFMAFSSIGMQGSRYGSWGHQEYYGQPRSEIPKFGALLDANTPKR